MPTNGRRHVLPAGARAVAEALVREVTDASERLATRDPAEAVRRPAPGAWAPIEIVGHLIDSAANNLRRFVLVQGEGPHAFDGYDQDAWVARQRYAEPSGRTSLRCGGAQSPDGPSDRDASRARSPVRVRIGAAPVTVEFLAEDYLAHLRHHLRQLGVGAADTAVTDSASAATESRLPTRRSSPASIKTTSPWRTPPRV